jgi:hypothetical protein
MAKRKAKRLFPRKMASDFINTSQGIDQAKAGAFEIFQNRQRTRSMSEMKSEIVDGKVIHIENKVPETLGYREEFLNELILTPRQQAVHSSRIAREGPEIDLHDVSFGDRMLKVSTWNRFKVVDKLWLYFCRQQWVFVKETEALGRVFYSCVYKSKAEALLDHKRGRIFWAGEKQI